MISSIKMVGFKAIDHPQLAENVYHEHKKRLAEFNITALTSAKDSWLTNPFVYCICAIDDRNKILGSIRIQIADSMFSLPFEDALDRFGVNIRDRVADLEQNGKVAESCGLWCLGESLVKKINLSSKLLCFENVFCKYLNVPYCFGFCPNHTLNVYFKAGFKKDEQFQEIFFLP